MSRKTRHSVMRTYNIYLSHAESGDYRTRNNEACELLYVNEPSLSFTRGDVKFFRVVDERVCKNCFFLFV